MGLPKGFGNIMTQYWQLRLKAATHLKGGTWKAEMATALAHIKCS